MSDYYNADYTIDYGGVTIRRPGERQRDLDHRGNDRGGDVTAGIVLSSASTVVGPLVTPCDNPFEYRRQIMTHQPGVRAVPVWDRGDGYRTADGATPEEIIARWEKEGMTMWDELDKAVEQLEALSVAPNPAKPALYLVPRDDE